MINIRFSNISPYDTPPVYNFLIFLNPDKT